MRCCVSSHSPTEKHCDRAARDPVYSVSHERAPRERWAGDLEGRASKNKLFPLSWIVVFSYNVPFSPTMAEKGAFEECRFVALFCCAMWEER